MQFDCRKCLNTYGYCGPHCSKINMRRILEKRIRLCLHSSEKLLFVVTKGITFGHLH